MRIMKSKILNVQNYLSVIPTGGHFRLVAELEDPVDVALTKLGFEAPPEIGATILPVPRGPVSRFNAEGKFVIQRNEPKEMRYIRTIHWSWKQWSGRDSYEEHSDFRDIFRLCFPRDFIPPPSIELTYTEREGKKLVVTTTLRNTTDSAELNRHAINLLLETVGHCEVVTTELVRFTPPELKRVNWRMLPPGTYPWERIKEHVIRATRGKSAAIELVIMDRQETMQGLGPSLIYAGEGGFGDYLAYVFDKQGLVVLESMRRDNALYVFGKNWREVSQLTKAEILSNSYHVARIVHTKGWKGKLARLLARRAAA